MSRIARALPYSPLATAWCMTLTGTQIEALLEQQFRSTGDTVLQVSEGFSHSWSASASVGSKVDPPSIMIGGTPLDRAASYRVTVNSFLADGGDGFIVLIGAPTGSVAISTSMLWWRISPLDSPVAPGPQNRITQIT